MVDKTPQTLFGAVQKFLSLRIDTSIAIKRCYDEFFYKQYIADKKRDFLVTYQTLKLDEHRDFGSEIAAAKFVLGRSHGRVRIQDGTWLSKEKQLPQAVANKKFQLKYIDLSKTGILTEGIDNLIGLNHVESIDLSDNPGLDDFACDMLGRQFRYSKTLKEINLSFNPYISIYGLNCLFRIPSLTRLAATSTMASNHEQKELFQVAAEVERNCEVIL